MAKKSWCRITSSILESQTAARDGVSRWWRHTNKSFILQSLKQPVLVMAVLGTQGRWGMHITWKGRESAGNKVGGFQRGETESWSLSSTEGRAEPV